MPAYYHQYKIALLQNSVRSIVDDCNFYNLNELQQRLYFLGKKQNLALILTDEKGYILFGKNEQHITNRYYGNIPMSNQIKEYSIKATLKIKDSDEKY